MRATHIAVGPGLMYALIVFIAIYTFVAVPFLGEHGLNWISIIIYGGVLVVFVRAFTQRR
jgi:hypothetical protein